MSTEIQILKLFCDDRALWERYGPYFAQVKSLEREMKIIYTLIEDYYNKYSDTNSIKYNDLSMFYDLMYPASKGVMDNFHKEIINNFQDYDTNPELITDLLEQMMEQHYATKIINKLIPVMEGDKCGELIQLSGTLDEYTGKLKNPPKKPNYIEPVCLSIEDLVASQIDDSGMGWPFTALNQTIGGLRPKTLGIIYAYVDSGKTSLAMACCAKFASQLDGDDCICYCGNEEDAGRLNMRLTTAFTGMTKSQIKEAPQAAEELRSLNGFYRVKVFDNVRDFPTLFGVLDRHEPTILFMDQATKLAVSGKEEGTKAMTVRFNTLRDLSNDYNVATIGICQATGDCGNKQWIGLEDMYESRVAIQGELDYAIGVGRVVDKPELENTRFINIPKNKFGDSAKFRVTFNRYLCQWEEQ